MLILTKKLNIRLPNEFRVHSFLKSIPNQDWEGWTITRKGNTSQLNFSVTKTTNVGIEVVVYFHTLTTNVIEQYLFQSVLTKVKYIITCIGSGNLLKLINTKARHLQELTGLTQ
jgi:hypothetical protein